MTGWLLIANASAGSAADDAVGAVSRVLGEAGPVDVAFTNDVDELDEVLGRAEGRVVVAAGGDGTVHQVVQRLHRAGELADTVVGIVPLGTGNDMARGLGIPLDPEEAASRLVATPPRALDLIAADDGTIVVNAVHVGLGAAVVEIAAPMKERLGALAFPIGAAVAAARASGWRIQVSLDGTDLVPEGEQVLLAAAANLPTIGGGTPLCPGARPDDGVLDVVVALERGRAARATLGVALRRGRHVDRDDVVAATGREVRVHGDPVGHNADGEVDDDVLDRTYRVEPAAWQVRA